MHCCSATYRCLTSRPSDRAILSGSNKVMLIPDKSLHGKQQKNLPYMVTIAIFNWHSSGIATTLKSCVLNVGHPCNQATLYVKYQHSTSPTLKYGRHSMKCDHLPHCKVQYKFLPEKGDHPLIRTLFFPNDGRLAGICAGHFSFPTAAWLTGICTGHLGFSSLSSSQRLLRGKGGLETCWFVGRLSLSWRFHCEATTYSLAISLSLPANELLLRFPSGLWSSLSSTVYLFMNDTPSGIILSLL